VLAAVLFLGLGAGGVLALQASGSTTPAPLPHPTKPVLRPMTASGHVAPLAQATNAHCGQTITASLTLNGDLNCPTSNGLTVAGTSVNLNLGGHLVAGPGGNTGYLGIIVNGVSATVQNGTVVGFYRGVQVNGSKDSLTTLRLTYNTYGVVDVGSLTKITSVNAWSNTYDGIYSGGAGTTFTTNHALNNGDVGIRVAGTGTTLVTGNVANGNGGYGIAVQMLGASLSKNVANFNALDGIWVYAATVTDAGGNTAKGNDYAPAAVGKPEQCLGVVCS
jgi:parallel beta-helix repeat protein